MARRVSAVEKVIVSEINWSCILNLSIPRIDDNCTPKLETRKTTKSTKIKILNTKFWALIRGFSYRLYIQCAHLPLLLLPETESNGQRRGGAMQLFSTEHGR